MTTVCSCNLGLRNSKHPGCEPLMGVAHTLIFVPTFTSAGVKNGINLASADLDSAYFSALTANSDSALRWRPVNTGKRMQEVDINRTESKYKQYASGDSFFIQSGEKTFKAILPAAGTGFVKFLDSARCEKVSVFIVDRGGNLIGNKGTSGFLYPFKISDQSIDSYVTHPKDNEIQEVHLRFDFDSTEEDGDIGMIEASEMSADVRQLEGLYDAYGVFSSITATGLVVDIRTHYGSAKNPNRVTGMVDTDFDLINRATAGAVSITSVTESTVTPGVYTFVFASTAAAKLKLVGTYAGYDFAEMSNYVIETP